jgi:S-adenosylmethionine:diacylglycerol 3-amino-3-carboxypropyl transferase
MPPLRHWSGGRRRTTARVSDPGSAWAHARFKRAGGPRVLFGRMYEDSEIELAVFPPRARVFTVASAGCTAFALAARGYSVTAVDVNPAQAAYVRSRLAGGPVLRGSAERLLARLRRIAPLAGWSTTTLKAFCSLEDVEEQRRFWAERLDTERFRIALALVFRPFTLRTMYASQFTSALPARFDRVLRERLERGFATHPNRNNPYARQLLLGDASPLPPPAYGQSVDVRCADAAAYLERAEAASFEGFALSNVLDGADDAYAGRLFAAVRRAAAPGAKFVLRSLGEPTGPAAKEWAVRDRSLIWGSIRIAGVT